jgi:hypothetical protein
MSRAAKFVQSKENAKFDFFLFWLCERSVKAKRNGRRTNVVCLKVISISSDRLNAVSELNELELECCSKLIKMPGFSFSTSSNQIKSPVF